MMLRQVRSSQTTDGRRDPEPRATKITARLNAQGGMLEELHTVLSVVRPEAARPDARRAVIDENILHRPSLGSRVDVFEKLSVRYFRANVPAAVARMVRAIQSSDDSHARLFAYAMLLWNDALVFLLGCEWLAPRLKLAPLTAVTHDIELELDRLSKQVPSIRKWTPGTRRKVAAHYLGLLRDCGYASGSVKKILRRPFIPAEVVFFGAQLVIGGGESAARVPEHPLYTAMGLSVDEVVAALTELRREGRIDFAVQGGLVRLAQKAEAVIA